jgi:hypothetical protein
LSALAWSVKYILAGISRPAAKGLYFKGGRFEFADGADLIPKDPELKWIVLTRIQQRLIGPFDYTDIARSFDGAMARYGSDTWNFTAMYCRPQKLNDPHAARAKRLYSW